MIEQAIIYGHPTLQFLLKCSKGVILRRKVKEIHRVFRKVKEMEENFVLESTNKMQSYEGKIMVRHLKNSFLFGDPKFLVDVQQVFSMEYLDS